MSDEVTITLTRTQALALAKVADTGLRISEALGLILSPGTAERALVILNEAATRPRGKAPAPAMPRKRSKPT